MAKIPRPDGPEDAPSDEQLMKVIGMVAERLDQAEACLKITPMTMPAISAAQAYSAQAQALSLYMLIWSGASGN
jgi:hypothetical protein